MAESALQDIEFSFAGKDWVVRPEFKTIVSIEAALGQASRSLGLKLLRYEASVTEVAAVVFLVLRDKKGAPGRDEVGEIIMADGYEDLLAPLGNLLLRAIRGSKEHEKEAKAQRDREAQAQRDADPNPPQAQQAAQTDT